MRRLVKALLPVVMVASSQSISIPVAVAASTCVSSGSGYTATVCIDEPADGANVSGAIPVSVSVTIVGSSTSVQRVNSYLDGEYLLEDVAPPFDFELPTATFVDGTHLLSVEATLRNGFVTPLTSVALSFANGVTQPPVNTDTFTIRSGTSPPPGVPFVLAAVGDGAGGRPEADAVVALMASWNPNLFNYLGDVYGKGTITEFYNWYGHDGIRWDGLNGVTNPVVGNHEYENGVAPGYFDYWDNIPDYYSYDANGWHFIALNSTSQFDQRSPGSPQYDWLVGDLAASTAECAIAYFHHPVVSAGPQGDTPELFDIWKVLADGGVDIVLTGHDHQYQRWTPLDRNLEPDPNGVTEFVAGNGGHGIQTLDRTDPRLVASFDDPVQAVGALRLELNPGGATYAMINTSGVQLDSGAISCNGSPDAAPPSDPGQVDAQALSHFQATISWTSSTDNVGVAGYTVYRDGAVLAEASGAATAYVDTTAVPGAVHVYAVQAFDLAGNTSGVVAAPALQMPDMPTSLVFVASADAYVNAASPTSKYGTASLLRVDASPDVRSYVRFDVAGLSGSPVSVVLRVLSNSNSSAGFEVHVGDDTWSESSVTYATAPGFGGVVASSGPLVAGQWVEVVVPASVFAAGNGSHTVVLTGISNTAISMASRESGSGPELVVVTGSGSGSLPVADDVVVSGVEDQVSVGWVPVVSDVDAGDVLSCVIDAGAAHGVVSVASDCSSGSFVPDPDWFGSDSFVYAVSDGAGSDTGVVSVDVTAVNDVPIADVVAVDVVAGSASSVVLTGSDVDGDCVLVFAVSTGPLHGTAGPVSNSQCAGGIGSAEVVYTPEPGFDGADSFEVTVTDPMGAVSAPGVVSLTVSVAATDFVFVASADAYVNAVNPSRNYGSSSLRVDASPDVRSYVRFDVAGLSGSPVSVVLRVLSNSNSSAGFEVHVGDDTWSESSVTYATAPGFGGVVASSGPLVAGQWVEVVVPASVFAAGNGSHTVVLTGISNTAIRMASSESSSAPQLVVQTA